MLAGQLDHVHIILDHTSILDVDLNWDDLLDRLKWLTRGEYDGMSFCNQRFFFRLSIWLRLCANGNVSLLGRVGVLIKQTHQFFIFSLLDILSLDS